MGRWGLRKTPQTPADESQPRSWRTAKTAAAVRESTPIFCMACWTWLPAVRSLIDNAAAIWRSDRPVARRRKTSLSRGVRPSVAAADGISSPSPPPLAGGVSAAKSAANARASAAAAAGLSAQPASQARANSAGDSLGLRDATSVAGSRSGGGVSARRTRLCRRADSSPEPRRCRASRRHVLRWPGRRR